MTILWTKREIADRIAQTTGQHTRWLRFDDYQAAWFNGSDFVCQMNRNTTDANGNGNVVEWATRYELPT